MPVQCLSSCTCRWLEHLCFRVRCPWQGVMGYLPHPYLSSCGLSKGFCSPGLLAHVFTLEVTVRRKLQGMTKDFFPLLPEKIIFLSFSCKSCQEYLVVFQGPPSFISQDLENFYLRCWIHSSICFLLLLFPALSKFLRRFYGFCSFHCRVWICCR